MRINDNIQTGIKYMNCLLFKRLYAAGLVLWSDYWRPTMELLSLMAVMLEGLGFNLCVAPFLNVCVLNLSQRVGSRRCQR